MRSIEMGEILSLLKEYKDRTDRPTFYPLLSQLEDAFGTVRGAVTAGVPVPVDLQTHFSQSAAHLRDALKAVSEHLADLRTQAADSSTAVIGKKRELSELEDAAELARSWAQIEAQVESAKESNRLRALASTLPALSRSITELSKSASDLFFNRSYGKFFAEERTALRAPTLTPR